MLKFLGHRGRTLVILILLATMLGIVLFLNKILFPFLLASFLAYVLAPVIENLHQRKIRSHSISRGLAVLLVYFVILIVLIGGGSYVVPNVSAEMGHMIQELPKAVTKVSKEWGPVLDEKIRDITSLFPEPEIIEPLPVIENNEPQSKTTVIQKENGELVKILDGYTYEIRGLDSDRIEIVPHRKIGRESGVEENEQVPLDINTQISILAEEGMNRLKADMVRFLGFGRQLITKVVGSVFTLFLTFMVAAFILVDIERILSFWRSLVPKKYHLRYNDLLKSLDRGLNGVVRGQLMICLINGILTFIGLLMIGVPFAFTLSLVAMVFSLIPIFGTILSSIPIVIMGLTISLGTGLLALAWILLIHFIEGNFLNPNIMGTSAQIHPAIIVFVLVTGEHMAGIAGALLAVPVYSILQTFFFFLKTMVDELEKDAASVV
ncbi:MAG: AI-2E family transporter [SAR324 cluster bacterium]|jgi:predicted PurR-regulated permease PerM|nr:AI-2E family transporter [SAR324 cluster bacterium]MEC8980297.1 AI-2E family transporter [SAR324 cluster bacterium]MEC9010907.1 AI-2E family transporter [SAR324 cluster bacterium]MED5482628.1 AI-2E family transporter [SAR324 cluster bacterium]